MPVNQNHKEKAKLHLRNKNRQRYDLEAMAASCPALVNHIQTNKQGLSSINFSNPVAVKLLNKAILNHYYGIEYWDFPNENLCPPIPGRAEYIHHIADLLSEYNKGKIPIGKSVTCLDIGTGASCIYPIIGVIEYKWNFIGTDIDSKAIESAQNIINANPLLKGKITCKIQSQPKFIFRGILKQGDRIDVSICNPPFHSSIEDAVKGNKRKIKNLTGRKTNSPKLNFSGKSNELVYKGGEYQFIKNMVEESKMFSKCCFWFSSLVSKEANLKKIYKVLDKHKPTEVRTIDIGTGNKMSRIVAWTYLNPTEIKAWWKQ